MITVYIEFLIHKGNYPDKLKIKDGETLGDLMGRLGITEYNNYFTLVNGLNKFQGYILQNGDNVKVFPAMSGG